MEQPEEREALLHDLAEHKRELRMAVDDLRDAARAWTDPRDMIRERPGAWLLGGIAVGAWLGWRR